ncbi:MAG: type II and III secretion system protein family protein [Acidobacteriota bacterium]|jgi:pilus assembly protein CpaC
MFRRSTLRTNSTINRISSGLLFLLLVVGYSTVALAQERPTLRASFARNQQASIKVDVLVGQSRLIELDEDYERVSISGEKIAEVVPISTRQVMINGLNFGQVNLVVWAKNAPAGAPRMVIFDIFVQVNLTLIDNQIKILFPKENIQLSQANNSVVLSGSVTRPELAEHAQKIIEAAGLKVTNLLKSPVLDAAQVQLQVRIAEVNRQVLREIAPAYGIQNTRLPTFISPSGPAQFGGAELSNTGGVKNSILDLTASPAINLFVGSILGGSVVQGFLNAMYSRGALRDLAEPNLIAMHGQKANFLAGGEFPIPVVQAVTAGQGAVSIIYKEFGVKLQFTPTIIDENHIRLELEPEVSSLDTTAAIRISGFTIPGLRVRRAKTTLELRDGQSFALAGLIDNSEQVNLSKFPLLGDIPLIGELFKSRSFRRNETELLFLATVKIVEPLNPDQLPRLPGVSELKPIGSTQAPPNSMSPASSIEGESGHSIPRRPESAPQTAPVESSSPVTKPGKSVKPGTIDSNSTASATLPKGAENVVGPVGPAVVRSGGPAGDRPE